ncbi:MAG: hypothetical protein ACI4JB_07205, partial [Porcipelethomonas sp.]
SGIHVSRGDSAVLSTQPERVLDDGSTEPIIIGENACVIFTVKSKFSGNTLIKRILTAADYVNDMLTFSILPDETDISPYGYEYSFMYIPDTENLDEAYTYAQGEFEIMHSVSKITDLGGDENADDQR